MLPRIVRRCLLVVLLSLLTSLLPPAPTQAIPVRPIPRPRPSAATPLDDLPTGRLPTAPADAYSSDLPAAIAEAIADQVEGAHEPAGLFDGGFNDQGRTTKADALVAGPITISSWDGVGLDNSPLLPHPIPAGYHDSFALDVTVVRSGFTPAYPAMRVYPTGTTPPASPMRLWAVATGSGSETVTIEGIIGATVPVTQPMEVRLSCDNFWGDASCTFSNLRFYRTRATWSRLPVSGSNDILPSQRAEVMTADFGAIPPDSAQAGGTFFGIGNTAAAPQILNTDHEYTVGRLAFPTLAETDMVTMSMRYAFERFASASGGVDPVYLEFRRPGPAIDRLLAATDTEATIPITTTGLHGWRTAAVPADEIHNLRDIVSGRVGDLVIAHRMWADGGHRVGIDRIQFYLNGQPFGVPFDQTCGVCTPPQIAVAKPINTYLGNQFLAATDLAVASGGLPLAFDRSYTSFLTSTTAYTQTALGAGWRFPFATTLTLSGTLGGEDHTVIYEAASGQRYRFMTNSDGSYRALPGVHATLALSGTSYVFTTPGQATQTFNAQGRLTAQADEQGHQQTISYGSGGAGTGQPIRVTDLTTSRSLTMTYSLLGSPVNAVRLRTVSDDLQRTVTYTHSATTGDLLAVSALSGGETRYAYDGLHQLTAVWQPWNDEAAPDEENTYTNGRVTRQEWANGTVVTLAYLTNPLTLEQTTTITTTGAGVAPTVEEHHYRADGTLRYTTRDGLFTSYTTWNGALAPSAQVDGSGNVTRLHTSAMGMPTAIMDALGQQTRVQYDATNHPTAMIGANSITTTLTYGPSGTLTQTLQRGDDGTQLQTGATYDPTTKRLRTQTSPDGVVTWVEYDANGQLTTQVQRSGTTAAVTTTYAYDAIGRVTDVTVGADTALATTTHTTYRPDGQVATTTVNYKSGQPATASQNVTTTYGYDLLGRGIWTQGPDGVYHGVTHYNDAGQVLWTVENPVDGSGVSTVPAGSTPPTFSATRPDANVAMLYGYDGFGRTILVTQTGILTGGFDLVTQAFTATTTRTTRMEYDLLGRPVTTTLNYRPGLPVNTLRDVNVQIYTYYDGAGNVTWRSDALGRWTHTEFDGLNRPVTTTLNYEDGNPLTVTTGISWTNGLDTDLKTVTVYDAHGRVERTIQNYVNGVWSTTEPITDRSTLMQYDGLGRPITTTVNYAPGASASGINRTTSTRYDATTGRVLGMRDVIGHWNVPLYDTVGRSTGSIQNCRTTGGVAVLNGCLGWSSTHPDWNVPGSVPAYDALGRAFESENALGVVNHTTYDGLGRATGTIQNYDLGGPTTAITNVTTLTTYHDALGRVLTLTDPTSIERSQEANALGQTVVLTDSAGLVTRIGYDGTGMQRWVQGPDGAVTVTAIDGLGRPVQTIANYDDGVEGVSEPADQDLITTTGYDIAGRRIATMDPLGRITRYGYDLQDRLVTVTENALTSGCTGGRTDCNLVTTYQYDRAGNRLQVIDAREVVTQQAEYDVAGEAITTLDALEQGTDWSYNARSQVIEQYRSGVPTLDMFTGYDALGRIISRDQALDLEDPQLWTYDILGRQVVAYDDVTKVARMSSTGLITSTYDPLGRLTARFGDGLGVLTYGYDAAGRRTSLWDDDAIETATAYDEAGRPVTVEYGVWPLASYGYDSAGRPATITRTNDLITTMTYDGVGRVTDLHTVDGATTVTRFQYTYDRAGQRTQVIEAVDGTTRTIAYGYDGVGRLTAEAVLGGDTIGSTYDVVGNRLSVVVNSTPTQEYTYNDANQVIGYEYDEDGNLLDDGTYTYTYDFYGRLRLIEDSLNATVSSYLYHGETLQRIWSTGAVSTTLVQDTSQGLSRVIHDRAGTEVYGAFGDHLAIVDSGGEWTYPLVDALDTVRLVVDETGDVVRNTQYGAWGTIENGDDPDPFGFTGEFTDSAAGLVYLRARWYAPATGTLLGRDPFAGYSKTPYSLHPYQYGYSNPVNNSDPSGRDPWWTDPNEVDLHCDEYASSYEAAECRQREQEARNQRGWHYDGYNAAVAGENYHHYAEPYLDWIKQSAYSFRVPWQIVAGVLEAEISEDTELTDHIENIVFCLDGDLGYIVERLIVHRDDPGPGIGNTHISTVRAIEEHIHTNYGGELPLAHMDDADAAQSLTNHEMSVFYVAAAVRVWTDYRFGTGGTLTQDHHDDLTEWTIADGVAIWHVYRYGLRGVTPTNGEAGFKDISTFQNRDPNLERLLSRVTGIGGARESAAAAIPIFTYYFKQK